MWSYLRICLKYFIYSLCNAIKRHTTFWGWRIDLSWKKHNSWFWATEFGFKDDLLTNDPDSIGINRNSLVICRKLIDHQTIIHNYIQHIMILNWIVIYCKHNVIWYKSVLYILLFVDPRLIIPKSVDCLLPL